MITILPTSGQKMFWLMEAIRTSVGEPVADSVEILTDDLALTGSAAKYQLQLIQLSAAPKSVCQVK
jgi:hypothetical protein